MGATDVVRNFQFPTTAGDKLERGSRREMPIYSPRDLPAICDADLAAPSGIHSAGNRVDGDSLATDGAGQPA